MQLLESSLPWHWTDSMLHGVHELVYTTLSRYLRLKRKRKTLKREKRLLPCAHARGEHEGGGIIILPGSISNASVQCSMTI